MRTVRTSLLFVLLPLALGGTGCDSGTRSDACILGQHTRSALGEADAALRRLSGKAAARNLSNALIASEIEFLGVSLHESLPDPLREAVHDPAPCDPQGSEPCVRRYPRRVPGQVDPARFFEWAAAYAAVHADVYLVDYAGGSRRERDGYSEARALVSDLSALARGFGGLQARGMTSFEGASPAARLHALRTLIHRLHGNRVSERLEAGCTVMDFLGAGDSGGARSSHAGGARQGEATRTERPASGTGTPRDAGVRRFPPPSWPTDAGGAW